MNLVTGKAANVETVTFSAPHRNQQTGGEAQLNQQSN